MDFKTFYKLNRKKSIEEKLELIYKTSWTMSCDAFNAGIDIASRNTDGYEYEQNERYAMKERIRWLCRSIMEEIQENDKNH